MNFLEQFFLYDENNPLIFSSPLFWLFFGFILLVYQGVHQRIFWRNLFLLMMSFFFYYKSGGYFFTLLILSTFVDYYLAGWIYKTQNQRKRLFYLVCSLVVNLSLLAYFKYAYFFTDLFNQATSSQIKVYDWLAIWTNQLTGSELDITKIILPVGISFYTFQTLSYTIDIYRRHLEPARNIWDFAFFVSFFPQLVAGPIVRAADFIPQIYQPYSLNPQEYGRAIFLIINGLIKKVLISDYISINFVDRVFENPTAYSGFENLMAVYGYAIQIYCDFSGYTDMAIGLALLLGFRLNLNFNSPYIATSITDFWRRWHISLSTWLRDYLYISLGGNRKGKIRTYINLMLTMLLGGLWHGASMRFIIWGGLHGSALAVHKIWMDYIIRSKADPKGFQKLMGQIITFHFVCFCWIFFRASDMLHIQQMLIQIGTSFQPHLIGQIIVGYKTVFGLMLIAYIIHWIPRTSKDKLCEIFTAAPDFAKALVIALIVVILFQARSAELQPFIYFQF